jgi:hypothetical protein
MFIIKKYTQIIVIFKLKYLEFGSEEANDQAEQDGGEDELGAGGQGLSRVAIICGAAVDCDA